MRKKINPSVVSRVDIKVKKKMPFCLKLERCKPHKAACHPTKYGVINDFNLFLTGYRGYTVTNFFMLTNQMLC